jgi:ATP-dependent helicase/nuclease subunit B
VLFSRAAHGADGVKLVPSALWQEQLAKAETNDGYLAQGRAWRRHGGAAEVPDGALVPVGAVYPHTWSASLIEDMRTCPYRAVARRVLKLEPLPDFDAVPDRRELGLLFHAWMERLPWIKDDDWADSARLAEALLAVGTPLLEDFDEAVQKLWNPRMPLLARALAVELLAARADGWQVQEVEAKLPQAAVGTVHVSAKADRVDAKGEARVVIDYKTGQAPGLSAMRGGEKPQLPIEAWLLEKDGAKDVAAAVWRLRGFGEKPLEVVAFDSAAWRDAVTAVEPGLQQMAAQFAEGEAWPAWPDLKKGGVLPSGHCEKCPLAGVCRFQERVA